MSVDDAPHAVVLEQGGPETGVTAQLFVLLAKDGADALDMVLTAQNAGPLALRRVRLAGPLEQLDTDHFATDADALEPLLADVIAKGVMRSLPPLAVPTKGQGGSGVALVALDLVDPAEAGDPSYAGEQVLVACPGGVGCALDLVLSVLRMDGVTIKAIDAAFDSGEAVQADYDPEWNIADLVAQALAENGPAFSTAFAYTHD